MLGDHGPAAARGWNADLQASPDDADALILTLRSFTHVESQSGCNGDSLHCRADEYLAVRSRTGEWCGRACARNPTPDTMLRLTSSPGTPPGLWRDHILGATAPLDHGEFITSWTDWDESPDGCTNGLVRVMRGGPGIRGLEHGSAQSWSPAATSCFAGAPDLRPFYGDYNIHAAARLHAHIVGSLTPTPSFFQLYTSTLSPADHSP